MSKYFEIILPSRGKNSHRIIGYEDDRGCWLCKSLAIDFEGYVKIHFNDKDTRLHRAVFETFNGYIPDDLVVMHKCDTPGCCNPNHLEAGTAAENNLHKKELGRQGNLRRRLTDKEKDEIGRSQKPNSELAKIYNVSRTTIRKAKRNYKLSIKGRRSKDKPSIKNDRSKTKKTKKASTK